jgi:thiazole synthase ThiGH ThiG subunit
MLSSLVFCVLAQVISAQASITASLSITSALTSANAPSILDVAIGPSNQIAVVMTGANGVVINSDTTNRRFLRRSLAI